MTATINASTSAGVVVTSDTSGSLALQTANTTAMTINSSQVVNFANSPTIGGSAFPSGAMTLISTINANNTSSTVSFTGLSGYDKYILMYENLQVSSNGGTLQMQIGTGSGPTYITSGYYGWDALYATTTPQYNQLSNYSNLFLVGGYYNGAITSSSGVSGYAILQGMNNSTDTSIQLRQVFASSGGSNPYQVDNFDVFIQGNSTPKTAIKIYSGGNIVSGKLSLYGIQS